MAQQQNTQQNIRIGDRVRILNNAIEECWKVGTVAHTYEEYVWVKYGYPIYGMSGHIHISEVVKEFN